ncbi:MAG: hypothetical protein HQL17_06845 [Candidatus Omnitrophica bacterium]|nr:hypothetical protein [Candidatus Omnitrophota bacterium]
MIKKAFLTILTVSLALGTALPAFAAKDFNVKNDTQSFLFVNGTSGNVGLGTAVPASKLDVFGGSARIMTNGAPTVNYATNPGDLYIQNNLEVDGNVYLGDAIADSLIVAGSLTLGNNLNLVGNIGINTTVPLANLEIVRAPSTQAPFMVSSAAGRGGDYLTLTSGGNIGVGTSAPTALMHIVDQTNFGWRFEEYNNADGTNYRNFRARGTIAAPLAVVQDDRLGSFFGAGYNGSSFNSPNGGIAIYAAENYTSASTGGTYIKLGTTPNGSNPGGGGIERVRISNAGNVGIGTTAPRGLLEVDATPYTSPFIVTTALNVGVGVVAPVAKLHVGDGTAPSKGADLSANSAFIQGNLEVDGKLYGDGSGLTGISGAISGLTQYGVPRALNATTLVDSGIYLDANGNVGIGTAVPIAKFDVIGQSTGAGTAVLRVLDSAKTLKMYVADTGAVSASSLNFIAAPLVLVNGQTISGATAVTRNSLWTAPTFTTTAGQSNAFDINPTYNQSGGTAANTDLLINRVETSIGSGNQRLIDAQVGGVSKLVLTNTGNMGVGTTTPRGLFEVDALPYTSPFIVTTALNVGVGTSAPNALLQVGAGISTLAATLSADSALIKGNLEVDGKIYGDGSLLTGINAISGLNTGYIPKAGSSTTIVDSAIYQNGGNVGIGTTVPGLLLNGVTQNSLLHLSTSASNTDTLTLEKKVDSGQPQASFNRARLTGSAVALSDVLGSFSYRGHDGTSYQSSASFGAIIDGAVSAGVVPSSIFFRTTATNSPVDRMRITSAGNIGIGTTAPVAMLHVGTTPPSGTADLSSNSALIKGNLEVDGKIYGDGSQLTGISGTIGGLTQYGVPRALNATTLVDSGIYTDVNGNVGIGSTLPQTTLDVVGLPYFTKPFTGTINSVKSAIQIGLGGTATYQAGSGPSFLFFAPNSAGTKSFMGRLSSVWENNTAGSEAAGIVWNVRANSADVNAVSEVMRVTSVGNVGIGTSVPMAKLNIVASGSTTGTVFEIDDSLYTPKVTVLDNGNVGIGTVNPLGALQIQRVAAGAPVLLDVYSTTATQAPSLQFRKSSAATQVNGATADGEQLGAYNFWGNSGSAFTHGAYVGAFQQGAASTYTPANLQFKTSDGTSDWATRMIVDMNGNVGIGTTVPASKLDVFGGTARIMANGSPTVTYATNPGDMYVQNNLEVDGNVYLGDAIADSLIVAGSLTLAGNTNYTGPVTITTTHLGALLVQTQGGTGIFKVDTQNGNVGIGSVSPAAVLDIASAASPGTSILLSGDNSSEKLEIRSSLQPTFIGRNPGGTVKAPTATTSGKILFSLVGGGHDGVAWTAINPSIINMLSEENWTATAHGSNITFGTTPQGSITRTERMRVSGSGNVGIGTTAPRGLLEVDVTPYTSPFIVTTALNVGVGVVAPVAKLHVGDGTAPVKGADLSSNSAFIQGNLEVDGKIYGDGSALTGLSSISGLNAGYLSRAGSSTTIVDSAIYQNGSNMGIGTVAPVARLEIVGTGTSIGTAFQVDDNLYSPKVVILDNGNVGIGSVNPGYKLDIQGSFASTASTFPVAAFMRTTALTGGALETNAGIASGFSLRTKTSGDMTDGFGGGLVFTVADNTSEPALNANIMASIYARRDGADNKGLLQFFVSGTNALSPTMTLRNNGNIGIGTTMPSAKLELVGVGTGAGAAFQIDDNLYSPKVTVLDNGNVGLGTVNPMAKLHISSDDGTSVAQVDTYVDSSASWSTFKARKARGSATAPTPVQSADTLGAFTFTGTYNNGSGVGLFPGGGQAGLFAKATENYVDATHLGTDFSFETTAIGSGTRTEKLRVTGGGNIGIGTSLPAALLHVGGAGSAPNAMSITGADAYIKGNLEFDGKIYGDGTALTGVAALSGLNVNKVTKYNGSALVDSLIYDNGTNVGIGTVSPGFLVEVNSSANSGPASTPSILVSGDANKERIEVRSSVTPAFQGKAYGGTISAPTATPANASLLVFGGSGHDGTGWISANPAAVGFNAEETFTPTARGTYINWFTTITGTTTKLERMRITGSGNIGIGTTAPRGLLEVDVTPYTSPFIVTTALNVGVGVVAPVAKLHVGDGTAPVKGADLSSNSAFIQGNLEVDGKIYGDGSALTGISGAISGLTQYGVPRALNATTLVDSGIYTDVNGNVGIGTTIPKAVLDVVGVPIITRAITGSVNGTQSAIQIGLGGTGTYGVGSGPSFLFFAPDSAGTKKYMGRLSSAWENNTAGSEAASILWSVRANGADTNATTERMRLTSAGNFGIGTTAPRGLLEVDATPYTSPFIVTTALNVGVGTVTPTALLQVGAGQSNAMPITGKDAYIAGNLEIDGKIYGDGSGLTGISGAVSGLNAGYITQAGSSTTIVDSTIYQNGSNIGIGSTTPTQKLQVVGQGFFSSSSANQDPNDASGPGIRIGYNTGGDYGYINAINTGVSYKRLLLQTGGGFVGIRVAATVNALDVGAGVAIGAYAGTDTAPSNGLLVSGNVGVGTSAPRGLFEVDALPYTSPFIVTTALNVGVGTVTPTALLQVGAGQSNAMPITGKDAYIAGNLEIDGKIYGDGSALTGVSAISGLNAGYISRAGSSSTIVDSGIYQSGSYIGIGTTAPGFPLTIDTGSGIGLLLQRTGLASVQLYHDSTSGSVGAFSNNDFSIVTNNVARITVLAGGNVGVGTSAPVALFHVGSTPPSGTADLSSNSAFIKGNLEVDGKIYGSVVLSGPLVLTPPVTGTLNVVAGTGITPLANSLIRIAGNAGPVVVSANPAIVAGSDGQELVLLGSDNTNTVTFNTGNGLALDSGVSFTMGAGDVLRLIYDAANSVWREVARTNI